MRRIFATDLNSFDTNRNYFEVFKLGNSYDLDVKQLSNEFKALQRVYHPDKFANKSLAERNKSEELSSLVNKAYQTLTDPHKRGIYLLRLYGKQIAEDESEIQLDGQFLEEMMEINEQLSRTNLPIDELKKLYEANNLKLEQTIDRVSKAFATKNLDEAKQALVHLKFYKNLAARIKEQQW